MITTIFSQGVGTIRRACIVRRRLFRMQHVHRQGMKHTNVHITRTRIKPRRYGLDIAQYKSIASTFTPYKVMTIQSDTSMKRKWECLKRCKTESKRIVLNKCIGGFGLSDVACHALMERLGYVTYDSRLAREVMDNIERDHPILLAVMEEFGKQAWVPCGENEWIHRPMIVEIVDPDIPYTIVWMDGMEIAVPTDFERTLGPF